MDKESVIEESDTSSLDGTEETTIIFGDADGGDNDDDGLAGLDDITKTIMNGEDESAHRIQQDLSKYIELLPHATSSFNAFLDADHNSNDDKARGLLRYYEERPNLLEYTLEKELPRMDYVWIDQDTGEFIQDKDRIAALFVEASKSDQLYILPRCANQSLLADLLQFLTSGEDNALIRRQYHMAVHTRKVSIVVMPSNGTVLAKAKLELSLPHPTQGLMNVANAHVSCQFSPLQSPPMFHYHVEDVELVQPCPDNEELLEMAYFLHDLPSQVDVEEEESTTELNYSRRDALLQRTKNSWKQMNANLSRSIFRMGDNKKKNTKNNNTDADTTTTAAAAAASDPSMRNESILKKQMGRLVGSTNLNKQEDPASTALKSPDDDDDDVQNENKGSWKKQRDSLKKQMNRFTRAVGKSAQHIIPHQQQSPEASTTMIEDESLSSSSSPSTKKIIQKEGLIAPSSSNTTSSSTSSNNSNSNSSTIPCAEKYLLTTSSSSSSIEPPHKTSQSWGEKQKRLKTRITGMTSSVLEKAGSQVMRRSSPEMQPAQEPQQQPLETTSNTLTTTTTEQKPQKSKWKKNINTQAGRLRTGWNRFTKVLPTTRNKKRESTLLQPSSNDIDFSKGLSDADEIIFDNPLTSPFTKDDLSSVRISLTT